MEKSNNLRKLDSHAIAFYNQMINTYANLANDNLHNYILAKNKTMKSWYASKVKIYQEEIIKNMNLRTARSMS